MLVENLTIQMHTNISFHVFGAIVQNLLKKGSINFRCVKLICISSIYFILIDPLGHCPSRHNVVHYAFRQGFGYFVKLHEFSHTVENIVIFGRGRSHLLNDGCDVSKNRSIKQCCKKKKKKNIKSISKNCFSLEETFLLKNQVRKLLVEPQTVT